MKSCPNSPSRAGGSLLLGEEELVLGVSLLPKADAMSQGRGTVEACSPESGLTCAQLSPVASHDLGPRGVPHYLHLCTTCTEDLLQTVQSPTSRQGQSVLQ